MYQFLETIKCIDGELINLRYHQSRFNLARKAHFRPCKEINLADAIDIPGEVKSGIFKCRIIYSGNIEKIEFLPHHYRPVSSLKLVESDEIDYRYKYTARQNLEQLYEQRGIYDDILIVKNGFISDSFTANVIFFDGKRWWTPDTPLLPGTQRARLIHEKKIYVCSITPFDLHKYQKAGLINALQDMENMPEVNIDSIAII
jgi:4-amino-4-deoxychorismate lyase